MFIKWATHYLLRILILIVPDVASESFFKLASLTFDTPPSFFELPYTPAQQDIPDSYFPYSGINHFSKKSWFLLVENGI